MATYNITITVPDSASTLLDAFFAPAPTVDRLTALLQSRVNDYIANAVDQIRTQMKVRIESASADDLVFALGQVPKVPVA